ncbi:MAG TPA: N-acyl homoserine lactonase family protein [Allosphingosinicella sp.]|nr:N-acyl homoserine lactonase family protein [Allosphingosinicella sp.]
MKILLAAATALLTLGAMQAPPAPAAQAPLSLWRLDCGDFVIKDYNAFFSDTLAYPPRQPKDITSSCYLIRNGSRYMLWDTGVSAALVDSPIDNAAQTIRLNKSIVTQLAEIGVKPEQIEIVGISHFHGDHIGQAASFPKAKLVMGKGDLDALRAVPPDPRLQPDMLKPWLKDGAPLVETTGDVDIFHDGRVIMLNLPGHTPGHTALLVRLASGAVLLTGDLYHFAEQVPIKGVPPFNTNRADTLASMDRFDKLARNLRAKVIIQHEPADIAKLPRFPQAAQ